jgi:hypothetical protein
MIHLKLKTTSIKHIGAPHLSCVTIKEKGWRRRAIGLKITGYPILNLKRF